MGEGTPGERGNTMGRGNMMERNTSLTPPAQQAAGADHLDVIRIETALSRYPIHRLANKGIVSIDIRKKDDKGATLMFWNVDYGNRHGQPGPLAYKLDTLVINRRIDEAGRPTPRVLRLGSLHEIARELGLDRNTTAVRKALLQNVGAIINAKITYKAVDRTERTLEAVFSRYSVVFTGEQLPPDEMYPEGRKADCVYLILNEPYAEVINAAPRRPQDYEYLQGLPPAPQRFYEILSYQMLPAIKYGQRAKLPYSEFCLYSTMTRYFEFDQLKKQMYKIHLPHLRAGYLAKIEYEATVDEDGRRDWNMFYQPGEAARRQQHVFEFGPAPERSAPVSLRPESVPSSRKKAQATPQKASRETKVSRAAMAMPAMQLALHAFGAAEAGSAGPSQSDQVPAQSNPAQSNQKTMQSQGKAETGDEAAELVRAFYALRYGRAQEPTGREIAEARQFLTDGAAWARYLVEFAARQGKEKNAFPNDFGGVKKLTGQARAPFDVQHKAAAQARLKEAHQRHAAAHTGPYQAFLGSLLGGDLESSLPEVFAAFCAQEQSTFRFHQARAEKSLMSARLVERYYAEEARIARLGKFILDNPKCGLPSFWEWDAKWNPTPFQDPTPFRSGAA